MKKQYIKTDIYAILGEDFSNGRDNITVTKELIEAGIKVIQYREKNKSYEEKLSQCLKIRELTEKDNVLFIVNDDLKLALESRADGIHLGQDDINISEVQQKAPQLIIGLSTHNKEEALEAVDKGADYIGVGPTYFTTTKKDLAEGGGLDYLNWVSENINIPHVAIGGIKQSNIKEVQSYGGKTFAMISDIIGAGDIKNKVNLIRSELKMNYTTQMDAAKKGIITKEMEVVAEKEKMDVNALRELVAEGKIAIPANKNHKSLSAEGIGQGLRTKINVNLGISKDCCNVELEMDKVRTAIQMGAEAIMDLSNYGKTEEFRKKIIEESPAMLGTVPMYDAVGFIDKELKDITVDDYFRVVEKHAEDGVDFLTIHAGLNREAAETFKRNGRLTNIVSRGGSLLFVWMELNNAENPFYEYYDRLLDICEKHDVTLSLGDALRPGSIQDATDASQIKELITLGELTKRAWERNVQVMIEGPGHMAINEIEANMVIQKRLCHGAPFYVLGPLVTDVAPGYDHITSAIGGAIAATYGADFLCYVTPAEHIKLPNLEDMKEGIVASKIAAHAADIAKGVKGARDWDNAMSKARQEIDWKKMFELALEPERPKKFREESKPEHEDSCTMCGKMCSMRNMNKILSGEDINIRD